MPLNVDNDHSYFFHGYLLAQENHTNKNQTLHYVDMTYLGKISMQYFYYVALKNNYTNRLVITHKDLYCVINKKHFIAVIVHQDKFNRTKICNYLGQNRHIVFFYAFEYLCDIK